jgi:predicted DNA-binding transcriptional regulator YafY
MQINRLFEIVYILLERSTVTAKELAGRFEVSQRTIYRDVETLSQTGIPIYMSKGKGGGISLLPEFVLNKAVLTEEEKRDILSSMRAVSALSLSADGSALQKLQSLLGKKNCDWIEVDFSSWGHFGNDAETFEMIKTAIIDKRVLSFLYASGKAEKLPREVYPLKLLFKGAAWYMYAYCTLRKDYRFFKLRRIESPALLESHFDLAIPEHVLELEQTDTAHYIKTEMLISAKMAFRVYDEISRYQVKETGDFLCEMYLPDIDTICMYASSFGEHAMIVAPREAVDAMRLRLENSLQNYLEYDIT